MVKRLHPGRAAEGGVMAAGLARDGFTGPPTVIEGKYGFLNVFLTAAFVAHGMRDDDATALLGEGTASSLRFSDTAVEWRGCSLGEPELARARHEVATSFGSCSFHEPITDLQSLGFL